MKEKKNTITVDVGLVTYCSLLAILFIAGVNYNHKRELEEHRARIRSRAEAQTISYRQALAEMEGLKLKSKPKYYFELVKQYINN